MFASLPFPLNNRFDFRDLTLLIQLNSSWKFRGSFDMLILQSFEVCIQLWSIIAPNSSITHAGLRPTLTASPERLLQLARLLIYKSYLAETTFTGLMSKNVTTLHIFRIIGAGFIYYYYEKYGGYEITELQNPQSQPATDDARKAHELAFLQRIELSVAYERIKPILNY